MLSWIGRHIVWFIIRCVVTLACMWTVQNILHQEGYYISFQTLLTGGVAIIVAVRFWMPRATPDNPTTTETTWVG